MIVLDFLQQFGRMRVELPLEHLSQVHNGSLVLFSSFVFFSIPSSNPIAMRSIIVFLVGSSAIFHFTRAVPLPAPEPPAVSQSDISSHLSGIPNQISHAIPINTIPTALAAHPPGNKAHPGPPNKVVANPKAVANPKYSTL